MSIQVHTVYPSVKLAKLLVTLENGTRPSGGVGQVRFGVPSLGGEHVSTDGQFNFDNIKFVPQEFFERMSRGIIKKYDVLVVKDGATTGKTAFVGNDFPFENAVVNEHVFIVRPDIELLLPEYLFFFLYSAWGQAQIAREFHGGAIGGINQSFADHLEIVVPPLPEQQRIISILRQADTLYQWRQEANNKAKNLEKALFHEMFGNPISNPQGWIKKPFEKICTSHLGKMLDKKQQTGKHIRPYLRNINVQWGYIDLFELATMDFDEDDRKKFRLQKGDVLICEGGDVGRAAIWEDQTEECYFQKALHRARPYDGEATSEYLMYLLWALSDNNGFQGIAPPMTIPHLTGEKLKALEVPVPPFHLQQEFSRRIQEYKKISAFQKESSEKLDQLFLSISFRAFTGELTSTWREKHKDELQRSAVERDKALGLRGEKPRLIDFEEGRVTPEELEVIRNALGNFAANLASYHIEISDGVARSFEEMTKPLTQSLVSMSQNLLTPFLESFRQSIQNIQLALPVPPDEDEINRQIDLLPLPQEKRAIHDVLDATSLRVLKLAHASPAYFTPDDLTFGGITSTHTSASLRVLDSLGFVRLVEIDGVLRYHVIDANTDTALKPDQLQQ